MVVDFTHIKEMVMDRLDHSVINDVIECNPRRKHCEMDCGHCAVLLALRGAGE